MAIVDPYPPSGSRDFLPDAVKARERVMRTIKEVFERFGFLPLETPAFERIEVLTGKYGDEGEKLIFKILKRGQQAATGEADLALRYDFTVPLARVVAHHRHKIGSIFKRYQIGPVWRADRPAKARFREFYQCDVDVVGSKSPLADAETILALAEALQALGLGRFTVRLNSRKVLKALTEAYGIAPALHRTVLTALDKLDKTDLDSVMKELSDQGVGAESTRQLAEDIASGAPQERARARLAQLHEGRAGLSEVDHVEALVAPVLRAGSIRFDPFLARGLDYYTGPVFEFAAEGLSSSIASGGRYDDLIGMFSKESVPACGGSLGLERIIHLMEANEKRALGIPQALILVWDEDFRLDALKLASEVRCVGVSAEVYLGEGDVGRQMRYASKKEIPFCLLLGPDERLSGAVTVKNMRSGVQKTVPRAALAEMLAREVAAESRD